MCYRGYYIMPVTHDFSALALIALFTMWVSVRWNRKDTHSVFYVLYGNHKKEKCHSVGHKTLPNGILFVLKTDVS